LSQSGTYKGLPVPKDDCTLAGLKECHPFVPDKYIFLPGKYSNLSFSLACWARDQASHLPTKSIKKYTKICPGQAKFESHLSQGQAGIEVFV